MAVRDEQRDARGLETYRALSRMRWPRSYVGKFLFVAFFSVHVPLISVVLFVALVGRTWQEMLPVLGVTLLATLAGTAVAMLVQHRLLAPVLNTAHAMERYVGTRALPSLPTAYTDDAGVLMRTTQETIHHLDRLIAMKNNLLAVLSHDTRAPLTTIMLANSLIADATRSGRNDPQTVQSMTEMIKSAAAQQLDLMNSILMLARADSETMNVERTPARAGDILERVAASAALHARQKEIALRVSDQTTGTIDVDVAKTEQVLNNLVTNAIKFTPKHGSVDLSAVPRGDGVEFMVKDSGIGISQELQPDLFTPFTRSHRRGTDDESGTGMGLWIAKTFTEVQRGTISFESAAGTGTAFRVLLPRADDGPSLPSSPNRDPKIS